MSNSNTLTLHSALVSGFLCDWLSLLIIITALATGSVGVKSVLVDYTPILGRFQLSSV